MGADGGTAGNGSNGSNGGAKVAFGGAVYVFFMRGGEVLMQRRANTGHEDGKYGTVSGKIDGGEDVVDAARREALEETGVHVERSDLRFGCVLHRRAAPGDEWFDFFFTCDTWRGEIRNAEPRKCTDLRFFPRDALPSPVVPYVEEALAAIERGTPLEGIGFDRATPP